METTSCFEIQPGEHRNSASAVKKAREMSNLVIPL